MNIDRLWEIVKATTAVIPVELNLALVDTRPETYAYVDCTLAMVRVDRVEAARRRDELLTLLAAYPAPERLALGPSYIEVGAVVEDQGVALGLFGLGEVLGLWHVITPTTMGLAGDEARQMAGTGYVLISGYTAPPPEV